MLKADYFRLGLCFAETMRIISFPRPLVAKGAFIRDSAAASNASTSGRASTPADSRRMNRT